MRKLLGLLALLAALSPFAVAAYDINFNGIETVTLNASTTSSNVQFTFTQTTQTAEVLVHNTGSMLAFVNCGPTSAVLAYVPGDVVSVPVLPGGAILIHKGTYSYCAGITATGITTLYFTSGQGN